jgi:hypothetical protein
MLLQELIICILYNFPETDVNRQLVSPSNCPPLMLLHEQFTEAENNVNYSFRIHNVHEPV